MTHPAPRLLICRACPRQGPFVTEDLLAIQEHLMSTHGVTIEQLSKLIRTTDPDLGEHRMIWRTRAGRTIVQAENLSGWEAQCAQCDHNTYSRDEMVLHLMGAHHATLSTLGATRQIIDLSGNAPVELWRFEDNVIAMICYASDDRADALVHLRTRR